MSVSVGIDLGTTYSAVAYVPEGENTPKIIMNSEGRKITPSVIQFMNGNLIFGSEAESAFIAGEEGCAATFKRSMGSNDSYCIIDGKSYSSTDLSALLLRHLKEDAERELNDTIDSAVITVPAYFYSAEREATIRAAEIAGLKVKKIIDEPNAAAMAYGLNHWRENANILVYDLGGGTFDVTLTHMNGNGEWQTVVTRGDHYLGGRDWDNRLENILIDKFEDETGLEIRNDDELLRTVRGLSEGTKRQLTSLKSANANASFSGYGYASVSVTRQEFEENTVDLIERTGTLCRAIMEEANLKWSDVSDILLVGGSTRMPQVSSYLFKLYGKKPITHVNPDEAVALGAAIQSVKESSQYTQLTVAIMDGKKRTDRSASLGKMHLAAKPAKKLDGLGVMTLRETTAHAMGMIAVSEDGTHYVNEIIIPANHPRPVKSAKAFSFRVRRKGLNEMEIFVLQGDKENPLDNMIPFRYVVTGLKYDKKKKGKSIVRIQYSYDDNGVINVEARQDDERTNLTVRRDKVPEDMSKYGLPLDASQNQPMPLNVVMAVDVSGSMSGTPIADAKAAMCDFVRQLDFAYTCVGVVAVSDKNQIVCGLTDNEDECIQKIQSIECGQTGYGNAEHPFYTIENMLKNEEGRLFAVILADGVWDRQQNAIDAAHECNENGIETAAIGFGGADYNFLRSISSEDANAMFVPQSELTQAFGSIAQSLGDLGIAEENVKVTDVATWEG